jgi:hypothetical protein
LKNTLNDPVNLKGFSDLNLLNGTSVKTFLMILLILQIRNFFEKNTLNGPVKLTGFSDLLFWSARTPNFSQIAQPWTYEAFRTLYEDPSSNFQRYLTLN